MSVRSPTSLLPALLRASHPGPTSAVTAVALVLGRAINLPAADLAVLTVAVLTGQLTIGWTNDLLDAARDRSAGRKDKPLARNEVTVATVRTAAGVAGFGCVSSSLLLGPLPAVVHLGAVVGSGLVYDVFAKGTRWSWLPFAAAFGMLPAVVTLSGPDPFWPAAWVVLAGALLGVAAHLVNALPDLDDDRAAGVLGLPQRLGPQGTRRLAAVVLAAATATLAWGAAGRSAVVALTVGGLATIAVAVALVPRWPAGARTQFVIVVVLALADVLVLVRQGLTLR